MPRQRFSACPPTDLSPYSSSSPNTPSRHLLPHDHSRFPWPFDDGVRLVQKIRKEEVTGEHHRVLAEARLEDRRLVLPVRSWTASCLGWGQEKVVFCVSDDQQRVCAVECIDERTYKNGRAVEADYFFVHDAAGLDGVRWSPLAIGGLRFTGLIKVREFIYGYVWCRFPFDPRRPS